MDFEVNSVFGRYEGRIDRDARKVRAVQPSTGKSVTLEFDDFRGINPAPELEAEFGGGCRGIHIKVSDLINQIEESEKAPDKQAMNFMAGLQEFCHRHNALITIALMVLSILIALVAVF